MMRAVHRAMKRYRTDKFSQAVQLGLYLAWRNEDSELKEEFELWASEKGISDGNLGERES